MLRSIAITGGGKYKNVGILHPAMLLGARRIMYKPITAQELQSAIEETLPKPT